MNKIPCGGFFIGNGLQCVDDTLSTLGGGSELLVVALNSNMTDGFIQQNFRATYYTADNTERLSSHNSFEDIERFIDILKNAPCPIKFYFYDTTAMKITQSNNIAFIDLQYDNVEYMNSTPFVVTGDYNGLYSVKVADEPTVEYYFDFIKLMDLPELEGK